MKTFCGLCRHLNPWFLRENTLLSVLTSVSKVLERKHCGLSVLPSVTKILE